MAGGRKKNLEAMAAAPVEAAPDLLGAEDYPDMDGHPPVLPGNPPVDPLGHHAGKLVFLDRSKQVQITGTDCKKGDLKLWFGNEYLLEHFEQIGRGNKPTGKFDQDDVQTALVEACWQRGIFNPQGKVFGRGAHRPVPGDDVLVLHIGREVLIAREGRGLTRERAGRVVIGNKELFFPADAALPPPAAKPSPRSDSVDLLAKFNTWNWAQAEAQIDDELRSSPAALLLLGWVMQGHICGGLDWRSHAWLVAPTGAGKSTLFDIIRAILDDWVLKTEDATEAGIRQVLNNDRLAVTIDEAEPHDNPERVQGVLNLIKKSSSGGGIIRGGADHKATEFTAQSAFLLASVMHATMRGEDRNRIALLELRPLPEETPPLEMELARWRSVGRGMQRRMVEHWPRFGRTLAAYKRAIGGYRFDPRTQDTYGTLLACADMALYDYAPDDKTAEAQWEPGMDRVASAVSAILPMLAKVKAEAKTDTERAIGHLLSKPLPGAGGQPPEPVGLWLSRAMALDKEGLGPNETARDKLKSHGLRVVQFVVEGTGRDAREKLADAPTEDTGWQLGYLAFAYSTNAALQELWRGTDWSGDGYLQSLRKIPGIRSWKVRFAGPRPDNALLVPLEAFREEEG